MKDESNTPAQYILLARMQNGELWMLKEAENSSDLIKYKKINTLIDGDELIVDNKSEKVS